MPLAPPGRAAWLSALALAAVASGLSVPPPTKPSSLAGDDARSRGVAVQVGGDGTTAAAAVHGVAEAAADCSPKWGQCGGRNWNGAKCCEAGSHCVVQNEWYFQCVKGSDVTPAPRRRRARRRRDRRRAPPPPLNPSEPAPPPRRRRAVLKDRCTSHREPLDSKCTGCPPMFEGKLCASTTWYNDRTKGACGCGTEPPALDYWTLNKYTAALSCKLLDSQQPTNSWCVDGCGGCWELCTTGGTTNNNVPHQSGECIVTKVTNRCGDGYLQDPNWCNQEMTPEECFADPAKCGSNEGARIGYTNQFGYTAHFDLMDFAAQIRQGRGWNNPEVTFERVSCDRWEGPQWDCQCPQKSPWP